MANWVEKYYDRLAYDESAEAMGRAIAEGFRAELSKPSRTRQMMPAIPIASGKAKGSIPIKSIRFGDGRGGLD